jgi:histidinol phosphatase-like PHP family hydrolase
MAGYDFHIHSIFSDGELIPAEIVHRCAVLGYDAVAITDHADNSNLEFILNNLVNSCKKLSESGDLEILPGIELTHVPLSMLEDLVKKSKNLGAKMILVHGETLSEPVIAGTNLAAVQIPEVNILAHPGLISLKEAEIANKNDVYLELTTRKGHSLTNGHVVKVANQVGAKLILNSDTHSPVDFNHPKDNIKFVQGTGIDKKNSDIITSVNPKRLLGSI